MSLFELFVPPLVAVDHHLRDLLRRPIHPSHEVSHANLHLLRACLIILVAILYRQSGLDADGFDLRARIAFGLLRQAGDIDILTEAESTEMHLEDGFSGFLIGRADVEDLIEAARAHQCRVHGLGPVGGGEDEDARQGLEAVHLGKEGCEDVDANRAAAATAACTLAADGVDLVEEDDGWRGGARALEEGADGSLRLADIHVEKFCALDGEEVEGGFGGHGLGGQSLGASRGAVKEETLGWVLEDLATLRVGVLKRKR